MSMVLDAVALPGERAPGALQFDVVVVGGSSGAVGAALGAARPGATVALIEDTPVLGGYLANGISNIDTYSLASLGGVFEEFRQAVIAHYRPVMETDPAFQGATGMPRHVDGRSHQDNAARDGGRWQPHVADRLLKQLVAREPTIRVFYGRGATGVLMRGRRVVGVVTERLRGPSAHSLVHEGDRLIFHGDVVVDATHEADVAAWAGAAYRVGREPRSRLEPHAGEIRFFNRTAEILPGSSGRQDRAIVSSGVRLTIKHFPEAAGGAHLLAAPPGYDARRYVHAGFGGRVSHPGGTTEMNVNPIGNEDQEANLDWPEATREARARMFAHYKHQALGFLYYLQTERGLRHLGLADEEYVDHGHVPYRLFVREARRIVGEATMTEADVNPFLTGTGLTPPRRRDSVAIGHYPIDSKAVRRKRDLATPDKGEGDFFLVNPAAPFQVPFGALVPQDVDGLLVPVALSATHVAFSAVRMDPTWVATGQAAGIAAALSVRARRPVRDVDLDVLQRELVRQRCKLFFYWDLPDRHSAFAPVQLLSARGLVSGYLDRTCRPDAPLTRAECAALVVRALDVWPSVSGVHFPDVPYHHWAFRAVETLCDRGALGPFGVQPLWPQAGPYAAGAHSGFSAAELREPFVPDAPVTWAELRAVLAALGVGEVAGSWAQDEGGPGIAASMDQVDQLVTRGEACRVIASLRD